MLVTTAGWLLQTEIFVLVGILETADGRGACTKLN
jgi:hypothetical protein